MSEFTVHQSDAVIDVAIKEHSPKLKNIFVHDFLLQVQWYLSGHAINKKIKVP